MIRSILSILAGLVTSYVLMIVFLLPSGPLLLGGMDGTPTNVSLIVLILCGALSAFPGGYLTGWIAKQKIFQHTIALSALILLLGLLWQFDHGMVGGAWSWWPIVVGITGVAFSLAGGFFRSNQVNPA